MAVRTRERGAKLAEPVNMTPPSGRIPGRGGTIEPRIEIGRPLAEGGDLVVPDPLLNPMGGGAGDLARLGDAVNPLPLGNANNVPGVLNPPDVSSLVPPPPASPPPGRLSRLWDGIAGFFGVSRPSSSLAEGGQVFSGGQDPDVMPDPVAARRAIALDFTPASDLVRRRTELDQSFSLESRRLSIYRIFQFPHAPALDRLWERFERLEREYDNSKNPSASFSDLTTRDFGAELRVLTDELNVFLGEEFKREVHAGSGALRALAEQANNPALVARVDAFVARARDAQSGSFDAETSLTDFRRLMTDVVASRARAQAQALGTPFTSALEHGLDRVVENLCNLHVAGNGLSGAVLENFVYSAVEWSRDFPPPEGTTTIDFMQSHLVHHFVLGTRPSADGMLATISNNMEGYRQVFGDRAGAMFYRQERLVSEIRNPDGSPSGFYMTVERGSHEYDTGLRVAIWEGDPAGQHEHAPVARLGFNFGADRSIEIVNIQGPSRELRDMDWRLAPRLGAYDRLQAALGGGRPFNLMLGLVIHWAHGAGIQRVYGIRDEAQGARASGLDAAAEGGADVSGRGNMYRMIFGTFGFKSRADNPDYVVLDLTRGSHADYMAKVLRKGAPRTETGANSDGPERSFWGMLTPAWNLFRPMPPSAPVTDTATGPNPLRIPKP